MYAIINSVANRNNMFYAFGTILHFKEKKKTLPSVPKKLKLACTCARAHTHACSFYQIGLYLIFVNLFQSKTPYTSISTSTWTCQMMSNASAFMSKAEFSDERCEGLHNSIHQIMLLSCICRCICTCRLSTHEALSGKRTTVPPSTTWGLHIFLWFRRKKKCWGKKLKWINFCWYISTGVIPTTTKGSV